MSIYRPYLKGMAKKLRDRQWTIYKIAKKAVHLGEVKAATAEQAIELAVKEFDVRPEDRSRLSAQPSD